MALVTVTGTFNDGQGNPLTLSPVFTPSQTLYQGGVPLVTPAQPVNASAPGGVLKNSSGGPLTLLATDTTGITFATQTGFWFWTVSFPGSVLQPFSFFLKSSPSTVDLSALAGTPAGGVLYLPLAGGTMTGFLAPAVVPLTFGASIPVNAALGNDFRVTLTASTGTIANPANPVDGQMIEFQITQDATGARTVAWGTAYNFGTAGAPVLTTTANKTDLVGFKYNAAKAAWLFTGSALGF